MIVDGISCLDGVEIYTPVNALRIQQSLHGYEDASFIIDGFTSGFSLGMIEVPNIKTSKKVFKTNMELTTKILDEVEKGRIIGPVTEGTVTDLMISPVRVIPKPNSNELRMIFNLSHPKGWSVNDNISSAATSVKYCSVSDVVSWMLTNQPKEKWFMSKVDLTDAYRMVPIKKDEWKFLGMSVGNKIFIDRCLPMGASSSCSTFQRVSDALTWIAKMTCPVTCHIFNYLDDFLIIASSKAENERALVHFEDLCQWLGMPLSAKKTVRPTVNLVFLGLGIDSEKEVLFVPEKKKVKVLNQLQRFLKTNRPRVREWQSTLGGLSHLTHVIPAGRVYLSSVYGSLQGILSQQGHKRRAISLEAREDLEVWVKFLKDLPPTKCFRMFNKDACSISIHTDASTSVGYGGVCGENWFMGTWPDEQWKTQNIALLELYPVYAALVTWKDRTEDSTVACYTDNKALVDILNKLYTRDRRIRQLLKPLASWCLAHNVFLVAHHIPGMYNIAPDLLSRGKLAEFQAQFPDMRMQPDVVPFSYRPEKLSLMVF